MAKEIYFWKRLSAAWQSASTVNTILMASLIAILGVIATGLFSPFGLTIFDDTGSAADWFAAVGTWVIGFGAMRLAAGDRELKLHERREKRLKEAKMDRSRLKQISSWASAMELQLLTAVRRLGTEHYRIGSKPHPVLARLAAEITDMTWGVDEQNVVGDATTNIAAKAHYELGRVRDLIGLYDSSLRRGSIDLDDRRSERLLDDIRAFARRAEASLKKMQIALAEDAQKIKDLIDSLEARLGAEDRKLTGE